MANAAQEGTPIVENTILDPLQVVPKPQMVEEQVTFFTSPSSQTDLEVEEVPILDQDDPELPPFMPSTSSDESSEDEEPEMCTKIHPQHKHAFQVITTEKEYDIKIVGNGDSFLMTCFQTCVFGECREDVEDVDSVKVMTGEIMIEVDGESVVSSREIDRCHFLIGREGALWKTKRDYFHIRFRIKEEGTALLLFSVLAL